MSEKYISKAVIGRLPRYYRYLGELLENDEERISSEELSKLMKVTASQIRQDFNNFGGFGQQGYGYNVKYLYGEIGKILGVEQKHNVILVGAGNLGSALAKYPSFPKRGFTISGIFDVNPDVIGKTLNGIMVRPMDEMEEFIVNNVIDIAAITVPRDEAQTLAEKIVNAGVKAIWNFSPVDLNVGDDVVVENVHMTDSLLKLSFNLAAMKSGKWDYRI
ncbi:redox-sensing transcriptional repressor Rex [Parasporobacterium paucivorans]|uniref:Redox-sensing transcriptional repressor Rex n=1 Tax=Parasporobacterium paucivorans DSM 15970 TaxID=1122934 RepID=A0A1M6EQH3_9FIRM|nr:redox-sensing transcriptional repressor Rex [Parasporobacterium paucivorans]SHI87579.1 redox-sensing transcriptional repressor [Parasporobacterium paucivorans DSM 15970]